MWRYPEMEPVAISVGPVSIHWYAITYLVGITLAWWLLTVRSRQSRSKPPQARFSDKNLSDIAFYAVLGVLLGGRLGYVLFYGWSNLMADPLSALRIWQGGMSFHGGLIGVLAAMAVYGRRYGRSFFEITDFIAPAIPLALGCGRIGNFVNGELPGRVMEIQGTAAVPWAIIYPGELVARHPSSLYQALLEGPVLFALLWFFSRKAKPPMTVSGVFLLGYGSLRIFSESFREPDSHLGFILMGQVTAGQLLSIPMVLLGAFLLVYGYRATTTTRV